MQCFPALCQIGAPTFNFNSAIAALRFFFTVTLEKPDLVRPLRIVNEPRKVPVVLSKEEVARLIEAAPALTPHVANHGKQTIDPHYCPSTEYASRTFPGVPPKIPDPEPIYSMPSTTTAPPPSMEPPLAVTPLTV